VGCGFAVPGLDFAVGTDSAALLAMSRDASGSEAMSSEAMCSDAVSSKTMSSGADLRTSKNCAYSVTWRSVGVTGVPMIPPARLVAERGSFDERRR